MKLIDNNTELLRDNLITAIHNDDKIAIAASCFSMYAFKELMEQLKGVNELRFIFTSSSFIKSENGKSAKKSTTDDKYEDVLSGTAFETKLRHVLSQKAVSPAMQSISRSMI